MATRLFDPKYSICRIRANLRLVYSLHFFYLRAEHAHMVSSESSSKPSQLFVKLEQTVEKLKVCSEAEERRKLLRQLRRLIDEADQAQPK
jgi:hypothetical protein